MPGQPHTQLLLLLLLTVAAAASLDVLTAVEVEVRQKVGGVQAEMKAVRPEVGGWGSEVGASVTSLLTTAGLNHPSCTHTLITQRGKELSIAATLQSDSGLKGSTTFSLLPHERHGNNASLAAVHTLALELKMTLSRVQCSCVVLVSDSVDAAAEFADALLKQVVLKWHIRLLWVTNLQLVDFQGLLNSHWIFAKMNAAVLSWDISEEKVRTSLHYHLPFSPTGPRTVSLLSWCLSSHLIFPDKYNNFHGGIVNVTARSFYPFWLEEADGNSTVRYRGTDFQMLVTLGQALNFSFRVIPTQNWDEVLDMVSHYRAFMASVMHYVYHHRLEKVHFTRVFDISNAAFTMQTPVIVPKWESLVYPFSWEVWGALLLLLLLVPFPFTFLAAGASVTSGSNHLSAGRPSMGQFSWYLLQIWKILLGQNVPHNVPRTPSFRLLLVIWMACSFLVTVIYKTNLIAHLTIPKAPFRPESLSDLVTTNTYITGPPYANALRLFFLNSENAEYREMGDRFKFVESMEDGMELARKFGSSAHVEDRIYLLFEVAKSYTRPDGTSDMYIAQEGLSPGYHAYPVPRNAPYLGDVDKWMSHILQAGLPGKWRDNELQFTLGKQRMKASSAHPSAQEDQDAVASEVDAAAENGVIALTLVHLQGPLFLLLFGWVLGGGVLLVEVILWRIK